VWFVGALACVTSITERPGSDGEASLRLT
jgi:hypothetical protein